MTTPPGLVAGVFHSDWLSPLYDWVDRSCLAVLHSRPALPCPELPNSTRHPTDRPTYCLLRAAKFRKEMKFESGAWSRQI